MSAGPTAAACRARRPASAEISEGRMACGQKRRSLMPVINSKRPSGNFRRPYNGASRRSTSSEVQTSGGSSATRPVRTERLNCTFREDEPRP